MGPDGRRDEHGVRAISPGPDQQLSLSSAAAVHRFDSVEDQVEDHLLHLRAIALHAGQSRREVRVQRDAMSEHFTSGHGDHLEDDRPQGEGEELASVASIEHT